MKDSRESLPGSISLKENAKVRPPFLAFVKYSNAETNSQ